jgi:hypothetical protein
VRVKWDRKVSRRTATVFRSIETSLSNTANDYVPEFPEIVRLTLCQWAEENNLCTGVIFSTLDSEIMMDY